MKRVALPRVLAAVEALAAVPLPRAGRALPGFFALKRNGVNTTGWTLVSPTDFADLAAEFYEVDGASAERPYFDPLGGGWKNDNWPRGATNTAFKRPDTPLRKNGHLEHRGKGENQEWKLNDGYEVPLAQYIADARVPSLDYAAWVYRGTSFPDEAVPGDLVDELRSDLRLTDAEFNTLFEPPRAEDPAAFFADDDWGPDALFDVLAPVAHNASAAEEGAGEEPEAEEQVPELPDDAALVKNLLTCLRSEEKFEVTEDLVRNVLYSLRVDRIAVLVNKPGTGKTEFVKAFVGCLGRALRGVGSDVHLIDVAVSEEFAEHDLIGYRDLAGRYVPSRHMERLNTGDPDRDLYVLLLDEMNLASIDVYGAKVIAAITNRIPIDLPGASSNGEPSWFPHDGEWIPHNGVVVIGTMNSYLEDPSRKQLSVPLKRRSNVITMPDPLLELVMANETDDVPDEFLRWCRVLLDQVIHRLRRRGLSVLESRLTEQLAAEVPPDASALIWRLARRLAVHADVAMALGLVQSILRYIQTSEFADAHTALDLQVEQKVLPVLRGSADLLDQVVDALGEGDWPVTSSAIERMRRLAEDNASHIRPLT